MILIADSGSTKTSWRLVKSLEEVNSIYTIGYNPDYISTEDMVISLRHELVPQLEGKLPHIRQLYFYAAGASTAERIGRVKDALSEIFRDTYIEVDHDLLAAARATCGKSAGIVCILGTGSNSCVFDGENITDNVTSLGFVLGDEGSGGMLGRRLVQAYYYREMPAALARAFEEEYKLTKSQLFENVYRKPFPNRYIASFAPFYSHHLEEPFIKDLLRSCVNEFLQRHVIKYEEAAHLPIHFIGSIALTFSEILHECLSNHKLKAGIIVRGPADRLVAYHWKEYQKSEAAEDGAR